MNRKERRAAAKQGTAIRTASGSAPPAPDQLFAAAEQHYADGQPGHAQALCRQILEREPDHARSANLLGIIAHEAGRHNAAVKLLRKAVALDGRDATYQFNLARAHEALGAWDNATAHFTQAIVLGLGDVESEIKESPAIAACLRRMSEAWPRRLTVDELFGPAGVATVARDPLLASALRSHTMCDSGLERFLTAVRFALLRQVTETTPEPSADDKVLGFFCGLAQQCFLNEYVFAVGEEEMAQARRLHDVLVEKVNAGAEISELSLAALATYFPLHATPVARALLDRSWSDAVTSLLSLQVKEPFEEAQDRASIPAVTAIDDAVSLQVQRQYEENPYPRWHAVPTAQGTIEDYFRQRLPSASFRSLGKTALDILVAGCGTGSHSIETGQRYPESRVLAVDLSLPSLAYARRKTRELGLSNIEYAQGDILKLGSLGRTFDLIESVGVLHHLADPMAGWRVLLSLLRPGGLMLIGLYSELARRQVTAARTFIAEKGYRPIVQDIRACRQELLLRGQAPGLGFADFFTVSGCRDLLFNVMEHRLSIPEIKAFLDQNGLAFLGFDLRSQIRQQFQRQFPDPAAATDLDRWHEFEIDHPRTFAGMYVFWVQRTP